MTKVTFSSQGAKLLSVDILGHAGYAEEGEDIVCAAISSAVMLTTVLLDDIQHVPADTTAEDEDTHIRIVLRKTVWSADRMRFAHSNCIFLCWNRTIRIF